MRTRRGRLQAALIIAALISTAIAASAQKPYGAPRTPWGHPHEGNNALRNMLSAARAEEKVIEEYVKKGLPPPPLARPNDGEILRADPSSGRRR